MTAEPTRTENRTAWNAYSAEYQQRHQQHLSGEMARAWGVWRVPESNLRLLGDVRGLDVLEFGCGGAQWSRALAREGARVTGLDLSDEQLTYARRAIADGGEDVLLVQADGAHVPLRDESFDLVLSDYGALTWADPYLAVPEAARVLRSGGRLVFCMVSPLMWICFPAGAEEAVAELQSDYFGMHELEEDGFTDFMLPYGEWIRLFRANDLIIEDLVETRPDDGDPNTSYEGRPLEWARRWPAENIWRLRKT